MSQPDIECLGEEEGGKQKTHHFYEELWLVTVYFSISIVFILWTSSRNVKTDACILHLVMHDLNLLITTLYVPPSDCSTFQKKSETILHSSSWSPQTDEYGCFWKSNML